MEAETRIRGRLLYERGATTIFACRYDTHGPPHPHIGKGRLQMVQPHHADGSGGVRYLGAERRVALEERDEISERGFEPVDLAILQCGGGGGVRDDLPFDTVHLHPLAAREPIGGFVARAVILEVREHGLAARHPFPALEAHLARADELRDLGEGVRAGDALGHDEGAGGGALAEREEHLREGLVQPEAEGPVVNSLERVKGLAECRRRASELRDRCRFRRGA
jgi:hypothetical protein